MVEGEIEDVPLIPLSPFLIADTACGIEVYGFLSHWLNQLGGLLRGLHNLTWLARTVD